MVNIGLIGDLHGRESEAAEWMRRVQPDFCLQVGDYYCYDAEWPVPVYWILGNHEELRAVRMLRYDDYPLPANNTWLRGGLYEIHGITVMALPGLPQYRQGPGPARFEEDIYDACMEQADEDVDVLISHGCAFPFEGWVGSRFKDFEEPAITELARAVQPTYAVSGHNHIFAEEEHEGITCIRMGEVPNDFTYGLMI